MSGPLDPPRLPWEAMTRALAALRGTDAPARVDSLDAARVLADLREIGWEVAARPERGPADERAAALAHVLALLGHLHALCFDLVRCTPEAW